MRSATRIVGAALPLFFVVLFAAAASRAQQPTGPAPVARPNILWVTSEDNAAHWLGCYGNAEAQTPRLDALAREGVQFTAAYSNAAVCAVARSTLLHGAYAVTLGTHHMRSRYPIPAKFKPYVAYLRDAGYYCTNNSKTDYNRRGNDQAIWDESSGRAHYRNRAEGQPFFAIFNFTTTHESSLFPETVAANRRRGVIPQQPRLNPDELALPPYLPDLPEVRSDFAIYHGNVSALDRQVGELLDELERDGLADDTIVFYFSDHGGPTPRGKRYLQDTGVRVPLLVRVPDRWRHLSPWPNGAKTDELVAFVDFAPTLLSLCGLETPPQMQGRAFLGGHRREPPPSPAVFLFADRFDELEGMRRGVTDGRWKYIRRLTPHLPAAPCSYYSLSMPSWSAWQRAWQENRLEPPFGAIWERPQPVEELYDVQRDPWEVHNLAGDPAHADQLADLRARLHQELIAAGDCGLVPESLFRDLAGDSPLYDYVEGDQFDAERVLEAALIASAGDPGNLPAIGQMLTDRDPVVRDWGALGVVILGDAAAEEEPRLRALLKDSHAGIRISAACALARIGHQEAGQAALVAEFDRNLTDEAAVHLINALTFLAREDLAPQSWVEAQLRSETANEYLRRFAARRQAHGTPSP